MKPMLRLATITFYDQEAWLTRVGLLPGTLTYVDRNSPRNLSIKGIQEASALHFGIPLREMTSARRDYEVVRPRQVAMYLSRQFTPRSLPEIGRSFGGRDHTTVIHAIRRIEALMLEDVELALSVQTLTKELEG